ncbi:hypothetical protein R1flu_015543 [Riccia fluitans]|uniref:Uncharacterized protein n=1 Tax=Riccia fluitans TaxID=41844 RepID=A0ABD1YJC6_9MARC
MNLCSSSSWNLRRVQRLQCDFRRSRAHSLNRHFCRGRVAAVLAFYFTSTVLQFVKGLCLARKQWNRSFSSRPLLLRPLPFKFLAVGFDMIDAIAEAEGISLSTIQFKALLGKACPRAKGKSNGLTGMLNFLSTSLIFTSVSWILTQYPESLFGVLLLWSGLELALVCQARNTPLDLSVMLAVVVVSIGSSTAFSTTLGFVCGLVLYLVLKLYQWLKK